MLNDPVELKSISFTPFVAYLKTLNPETIRATLQEKVLKAPTLFLNAPVLLNVSALETQYIDFVAIKHAVAEAGLLAIGVSGCKYEQQKISALQAELALVNTNQKQKKVISPFVAPNVHYKPAMIINSPIRTGQQIYARDCDLIVTSYVNAGAEVIADGNIHIYGLLRGRALAGANNNCQAQIFCANLMAELVSIAGQYWLSEQIPTEYYKKAVNLKIQNEQLVISYLT